MGALSFFNFNKTLNPSGLNYTLKGPDVSGAWMAINKSFAVIEFDLEGRILSANENFLKLMGYSFSEVVGSHHKIFCDEKFVASDEYRNFWTKMKLGEFESRTYKRITKDKKVVWI